MKKIIFLAVLMSLFIACTKDNFRKCKEEEQVSFNKLWIADLDPFFQYDKSKSLDMGDKVAIFSTNPQNVVQIFNKETGDLWAAADMGFGAKLENVHTFDDKLYYIRSLSSLYELDPLQRELKTLYDGGRIWEIRGKDNYIALSIDDSKDNYAVLVVFDLSTMEMTEVQRISYGGSQGHIKINLSLIYLDENNNYYLYYNIFNNKLSSSNADFRRLELGTYTDSQLNKGFSGTPFSYGYELYSISKPLLTSIVLYKYDPATMATIFRIVPSGNESNTTYYRNVQIRDDEILFYGSRGIRSFDKKSRSLKMDIEGLPLFDSAYSSSKLFLFSNYYLMRNKSALKYRLFDLKKKKFMGEYCNAPGALNNQFHFVIDDELYIITYGKRFEKFQLIPK